MERVFGSSLLSFDTCLVLIVNGIGKSQSQLFVVSTDGNLYVRECVADGFGDAAAA